MAELSLQRLAETLEARDLLNGFEGGDSGGSYRGVCFDPAPIQPGTLYVDLYGNDETGRARMREAIRAGVSAVATPWDSPADPGAPVLRVRHARRVLSLASAALHGFPANKLTVIGVTGSNGKTTTCCMLARAMVLSGIPCGLVSSSAIRVGPEADVADFLTTPDAPDLHRMLAGIVAAGFTHAVVEVSSHAIAHERVADVPFQIGVVTNLTEDHLDFHPTMQHYEDTKALLFERLPPGGLSIANADEPAAVRIGSRTRAARWRVGSGADADWRLSPEGLHGRIDGRSVTMSLDGPNLRAHNRSNAALAAVAALALGANPDAVGRALTGFPGVFRRLQCIYEGRFLVMDDMGTSPGNFRAAFGWLASERRRYRDLHLLTNIRGNRGEDMNRTRARVLARELPRHGLRRLWISGCEEDPLLEARGTPGEKHAFLSTLEAEGLRYHWRPTNREAMAGLLRHVRSGDLAFLLGGWGLDRAGGELLTMLRGSRFPWRREKGWFGETDPLSVCRNLFREG